ncbi:hypothetical protein DFJ74DRAFT_293230 [Hyaloraphidium curvatum]|nr:hypothetical protein DFJ74DRAFT_293230 [Hyaloraphidium curvatum]
MTRRSVAGLARARSALWGPRREPPNSTEPPGQCTRSALDPGGDTLTPDRIASELGWIVGGVFRGARGESSQGSHPQPSSKPRKAKGAFHGLMAQCCSKHRPLHAAAQSIALLDETTFRTKDCSTEEVASPHLISSRMCPTGQTSREVSEQPTVYTRGPPRQRGSGSDRTARQTEQTGTARRIGTAFRGDFQMLDGASLGAEASAPTWAAWDGTLLFSVAAADGVGNADIGLFEDEDALGPEPMIVLAPWPTTPETLAAPRFNHSPGDAPPDTGPEEPFSPSPGVYVHVSIPIAAVVGLVRHFFRAHPRLRLLHARRVCRDFPPRQAALSCLLLDAAGSLAQSMARGDPGPALQAHVLDPERLEIRLFAEAAGEIEAWLLADPAERTPLDASEFLAAPLIMHGWAERRGLFDLAEKLEGVCTYAAGVAMASGSAPSWETVMCSALRVRSVDEVRAAPLAPHGVAMLRDAWTAYHEFQGCLFALARIEAEAAARDFLSMKRGDLTGLDFLVGHLHTMPPDGTWRLSFQDAFDPRFADHRPSHVAPLIAWIGVAPPRPSLPAQLSTPDVAFLLLARTRLLLDALHAAAAAVASFLPYPDLDDCNESTSGGGMRPCGSGRRLDGARNSVRGGVYAREGARRVHRGAGRRGCVRGGRRNDAGRDPRSDCRPQCAIDCYPPSPRPAAWPRAALHLPLARIFAPAGARPRRAAGCARDGAAAACRVRVAAAHRRWGYGTSEGQGAGVGRSHECGVGGSGWRRGLEDGGGGGTARMVAVHVIARPGPFKSGCQGARPGA